MATSLKSRVIVKTHTTNQANWAGTYKLLIKATSIPSPIQAPNPVESTTLENTSQTFEKGINQSSAMDIEGNYDKESFDAASALTGQVDIINLYGTDGLGSVGKFAYTGEVSPRPSDVGGVDEILGMVVTATPNSDVEEITDEYTITYNETTGDFTVALASSGD